MSTAMALVGKKSHTAVRTSSRDQREMKGARCWAIITQLSIMVRVSSIDRARLE